MSIKITDHQRTILSDLAAGAKIKIVKATGDWLCCLPNGMGYRVRRPTMNRLYREQKLTQDDEFAYVISDVGRAALTAQTEGEKT